MNCPVFTPKCPENPDKDTRTDTRARIGNPDIVRVRFLSAFALSVSGLCPAESLSSPPFTHLHKLIGA